MIQLSPMTMAHMLGFSSAEKNLFVFMCFYFIIDVFVSCFLLQKSTKKISRQSVLPTVVWNECGVYEMRHRDAFRTCRPDNYFRKRM